MSRKTAKYSVRAIRVLRSVETAEQAVVALKYARLAKRRDKKYEPALESAILSAFEMVEQKYPGESGYGAYVVWDGRGERFMKVEGRRRFA